MLDDGRVGQHPLLKALKILGTEKQNLVTG